LRTVVLNYAILLRKQSVSLPFLSALLRLNVAERREECSNGTVFAGALPAQVVQIRFSVVSF